MIIILALKAEPGSDNRTCFAEPFSYT